MSVLLEIASERINQFNIRPYFTPIILNGWKSPLSVRACVKKNPSQKKFLRITPVLHASKHCCFTDSIHAIIASL